MLGIAIKCFWVAIKHRNRGDFQFGIKVLLAWIEWEKRKL